MKAALRSELRAVRGSLHSTQPHAADQLARVFQAAGISCPTIAAVYRAAGSEIDPRPLANALETRGVRLALPVVVARDAALVFREAGTDPHTPDALGLPAPPPHAPVVRPDLIFVPLLAFDLTGARLGQGGGYYDRTLAALRADGAAVRAIGLAYAGQQVDRLPTDGFDQRLDGVLTETAYLEFTGDRPPMPTTPAS